MAITEFDKEHFRAVSINLELAINVPTSMDWKALVAETTKWWPKDFYTLPQTKAFILEPKLGGRMFEKSGKAGAGLVWMTVFGMEPPKYLYLAGFISPPFGGPATSLLTINLSEKGRSGAILNLQDYLFGEVNDKMAKKASMRAGNICSTGT